MRKASSDPGLTEMLLSLIRPPGASERVSLAEIVGHLDDRARGVLIILFALPNCLPSIPGTSAITGLPLVFLLVQMALGRKPWLPGFLANRTLPREGLDSVLVKATPWLVWIEKLMHPRLSFLTTDPMERAIGALGALLSLTIMLPIPLGNTLPALALILFSMGLIGKDGAWILAGLVMSGLAAALLGVAGWAAFQAMIRMGLGWFGG